MHAYFTIPYHIVFFMCGRMMMQVGSNAFCGSFLYTQSAVSFLRNKLRTYSTKYRRTDQTCRKKQLSEQTPKTIKKDACCQCHGISKTAYEYNTACACTNFRENVPGPKLFTVLSYTIAHIGFYPVFMNKRNIFFIGRPNIYGCILQLMPIAPYRVYTHDLCVGKCKRSFAGSEYQAIVAARLVVIVVVELRRRRCGFFPQRSIYNP